MGYDRDNVTDLKNNQQAENKLKYNNKNKTTEIVSLGQYFDIRHRQSYKIVWFGEATQKNSITQKRVLWNFRF